MKKAIDNLQQASIINFNLLGFGEVYIELIDAYDPTLVYITRWVDVNGFFSQNLYLPMFSENMDLHIISNDNIQVVDFEIVNHNLIKPIFNIKDLIFLRIAKEFSRIDASYVGKTFRRKGFVIEVKDKIRFANTPARIYTDKNHIHIDFEKWQEITVPGRVWILLHEYAHNNKNKNPSNEQEADKNAQRIYFAAGFPRTENIGVLDQIFTNTLQNKKRRKLAFNRTLKYIGNAATG